MSDQKRFKVQKILYWRTLVDKLAKRIGKKISAIRRKHNLTSEKLAYENGISKGYMSDIENGNKLPSLKLLNQIALALEVDIKDLF